MTSVPAGGPSTVNGILYQLLYSLLTLGGFVTYKAYAPPETRQ